MDLLGFLTSYARKIWVEADSIQYFLSSELAGRSVGRYTDIAHFEYKRSDNELLMSRYLFSDVASKPWGAFLPMSCIQCGCIEPWTPRKLRPDGSIIARCVFPGCTAEKIWTKPKGAQIFSKDLGLGRWYVVKRIM